ncbi:IS6 family transposase [Natrinema sp. H-ect4]|uniref:IS6 family transposase n=1 Tax=Natrinema sp. H-ect4 TaxID=3242699 RepID=UPI0035A9AACF
MPENARLSPSIGQFDLDFVEREATPRLLMKLSIQLHLAGLSLSNTVRVLEIFGVERARSTVHNWVHKADLQPDPCRSPDHVAVDETVIRLGDEQYWLYAAVDPESNELLHTKLEPTRTKVIASTFFTELREKHDVDDAVFLVDGDKSLNYACQRHGLDFRYERHGNRNSIERVFREIKRRTSSFSNCFSNAHADTADQWLRSFAFAWNQLI